MEEDNCPLCKAENISKIKFYIPIRQEKEVDKTYLFITENKELAKKLYNIITKGGRKKVNEILNKWTEGVICKGEQSVKELAEENRANLYGANLCGADLCGADLCGANLCEANLCGANLCEANLCGADLYGADLCGADLHGANLRRADLRRADFCEADFCEADLRGANLDFSCWPLWCGSMKVKVEIQIVQQLVAHLCVLECEDEEYQKIKELILPFAQKSHRAGDLNLVSDDND